MAVRRVTIVGTQDPVGIQGPAGIRDRAGTRTLVGIQALVGILVLILADLIIAMIIRKERQKWQ